MTARFQQSAYGNRAWQSTSTNIKPNPVFFHHVGESAADLALECPCYQSDERLATVDPAAIQTFENQIETARAEQKQAEEQLIRLESERTKRISDREKLQRQMVSDERVVEFGPTRSLTLASLGRSR